MKLTVLVAWALTTSKPRVVVRLRMPGSEEPETAPSPTPESRPAEPLAERQSKYHTDIERDLPFSESGDHADCTQTPQLPVVLPEFHTCPGACPYSVRLPVGDCTKACITEKRCSEFNPGLIFGDPTTLTCEPGCGTRQEHKVVGCARCSGLGVCEKCMGGPFGMPGFSLSSDGMTCVNEFAHLMMAVYAVFIVAVVYVLVYIFMLVRRPVPPERKEVLDMALAHRDAQMAKTADGSPWPFWTTSVFTDDIAGQGIMQFFTWNVWMSVIALAIAVGAYFAYIPGDGEKALTAAVNEAVCGQDKRMTLVQLNTAYDLLVHNLAPHVHIAALPMTYRTMKQVVITDGAAPAEGMPEHGIPEDLLSDDESDPVGKYFPVDKRMFRYLLPTYIAAVFLTVALAWWQERHTAKWEVTKGGLHFYAAIVDGLPDDLVEPAKLHDHVKKSAPDVVGVSIAYDVNEVYGDLELMCDDWHGEDRVDPDEFSKEKATWLTNQRAKLDSLIVEVGPREHAREPTTFLSGLQSTGRAVVVMKTHQARNQLVAAGIAPYNGSHIRAQALTSEPLGVLWGNFREGGVWMNILKASGLFVGVMLGWLCLFIPYAMDIMLAANVPGQHRSALEETVLGLFISVGNAVIAVTVEMVADWAGVRHASQRHVVVLILGFVCVFTNTMLDILMALYAVKGATLNAAFEGGRVGYQEEFVKEMFSLIWPSYLLLPYLAAPIFTHILTYWLGVWIVRSRSVEAGAAKRALECPPVDVCGRYYDFCNNFSISLFLLLFTAEESYQIMLYLMMSMVMLHCIDRYLLLRCSTLNYFTNPALARWFSRVFGIPLGFFAAIVAWWGWKAGVLPHVNTPWGGEYVIPFGCFLLHLAMYWSLLEMGRPKPLEVTETYSEMAMRMRRAGKHQNYWNTNLAVCLRNKFLHEHPPGAEYLVPFVGQKALSARGEVGGKLSDP